MQRAHPGRHGPAIVDISKFRHLLDDRCHAATAVAVEKPVLLVPLVCPIVIVDNVPAPPAPTPTPVIAPPLDDCSEIVSPPPPPSSPRPQSPAPLSPSSPRPQSPSPPAVSSDDVRFVEFDAVNTTDATADASVNGNDGNDKDDDDDITIVRVDVGAAAAVVASGVDADDAAKNMVEELKNLDYLTAKQLQKRCKDVGVGSDGKKSVLIERLRAYYDAAAAAQ